MIPICLPAVVSPRTGTLVFALSQRDRDRFFPKGIPSDLSEAVTVKVEEAAPRSPQLWAERLCELGASVLVTSWSSPSLSGFLEREGPCPVNYVCHLNGEIRRLVPLELVERGMLVTNWGQMAAPLVAEHAVLLILASLRQVTAWRAGFQPGQWQRGISTRSLLGLRVGLHGFGSIARELVARLRPFGVTLSSWSAGVPAGEMILRDVAPAESIEALFAGSDVLVECEALTSVTRLLVGRALLERLPVDALFVNVGRGGVVDQPSLEKLAVERRVRVALDVFAEEPVPPESPLLGLPGAVLSPHIAGPTHDSYPALGDFALSNLRRYYAGEPLEALITPDIYRRST